jgi:beta-glucosidase
MNKKVLWMAAAVLAVTPVWAQQTPAAASSRVESLVNKMTVEEKVDYIGGTGFAVRAVPRLSLPALEMSDGPLGVRNNNGSPSTVYAAGIGLAATWNPELALRVGNGIGRDARARGVHFMLGPGVNIYRMPVNGRNFEYMGEDPFLTGKIATGYILGIQQQGVSATIKHYFTNNSEFDRHRTNSVVDERTLREIYLPAFEMAVKQGHVGAIMDSYNLLNGQHLTQSKFANIDVARKDWGFDGVMMSDWVATYDGVAAANGGLDLEMPSGAYMNRKVLLPALADGRVKQAVIDEKVRHILQTAERFGWLDRPQLDLNQSLYNQEGHQTALDAARESLVLLKNERQLLPLDKNKVRSILVVGPEAYPGNPTGGGSGAAHPFAVTSDLQAIATLAGEGVKVYYERGLPTLERRADETWFSTAAVNGKPGVTMEVFNNSNLEGKPVDVKTVNNISRRGVTWEDASRDDLAELFATAFAPKPSSHRFTGYYFAQNAGNYELAVQANGESGGYRVYVDDKLLLDNWELSTALQGHVTLPLAAGAHKVVVEDYQDQFFGGRLRLAIADQAKLVPEDVRKLAAKADVVVVSAGFDQDSESEGSDRSFDLPFGQDELIREVAAANRNTVVVLTSGGNVDASSWIDAVAGYVARWYPGEQGGTALAEVLFGEVNPSGRLPVTMEKRLADNPSVNAYYPKAPGVKDVNFSDGIFVGYRGYEKNHVEPLFPFGFGLSYTTFGFANLAVKDVSASAADPKFEVSFDVTNTGTRAGAEVAQLYIGDGHAKVERPAKELKGFAKVALNPGETKHVTIPLDQRSLAYYDVAGKQWKAEAGEFAVLVGSSSQQIELRGTLKLAATAVSQ